MTGLRYFSPDMRYLAAKSSQGGQDIYVAILVAKLRHQVEVVEVTAMETGLVTAKAIADGFMLDGRVVLDGIFFDTDKAVLKAESKSALAVIATFLADNPELKVYIVGHTDGTGGFDHNLSLSKNRAEAVVGALVKDYGDRPGPPHLTRCGASVAAKDQSERDRPHAEPARGDGAALAQSAPIHGRAICCIGLFPISVARSAALRRRRFVLR